MLTVPLPRPAAGVTAAQGTSLLAVQLHIVCVRTSIAICPRPGDGVGSARAVERHGAGSSATATCCSPTTIVPWRATGSALAAT